MTIAMRRLRMIRPPSDMPGLADGDNESPPASDDDNVPALANIILIQKSFENLKPKMGWEVGRKEPLDPAVKPSRNDRPRCFQVVLNAIHPFPILSEGFSVDWKQFGSEFGELSRDFLSSLSRFKHDRSNVAGFRLFLQN